MTGAGEARPAAGNLCWHRDHHWCGNHHDGEKSIYWGRSRSGRRWFWAVRCYEYATDSDTRLHDWVDTEDAAQSAAHDAVVQVAQGQPASVRAFHGVARDALKAINAEKRRARPTSDDTDTAPVEYLYGTWTDDDCRWHVRPFRITKKTPKRVYYLRREDQIGFVDRQELETKGEVHNHARGWWDADFHLYAQPPDLTPAVPTPVDRQAELSRLRAEAAEAHPDRGGSNEAFRVAHGRYMKAKIRARRQHQETS